ncbi:MAG: F-box protein [Parachlamydiaceae bacterium]
MDSTNGNVGEVSHQSSTGEIVPAEQHVSIENISTELLGKILGYLDPKDLNALGAVSTTLRAAMKDFISLRNIGSVTKFTEFLSNKLGEQYLDQKKMLLCVCPDFARFQQHNPNELKCLMFCLEEQVAKILKGVTKQDLNELKAALKQQIAENKLASPDFFNVLSDWIDPLSRRRVVNLNSFMKDALMALSFAVKGVGFAGVMAGFLGGTSALAATEGHGIAEAGSMGARFGAVGAVMAAVMLQLDGGWANAGVQPEPVVEAGTREPNKESAKERRIRLDLQQTPSREIWPEEEKIGNMACLTGIIAGGVDILTLLSNEVTAVSASRLVEMLTIAIVIIGIAGAVFGMLLRKSI